MCVLVGGWVWVWVCARVPGAHCQTPTCVSDGSGVDDLCQYHEVQTTILSTLQRCRAPHARTHRSFMQKHSSSNTDPTVAMRAWSTRYACNISTAHRRPNAMQTRAAALNHTASAAQRRERGLRRGQTLADARPRANCCCCARGRPPEPTHTHDI